MCVRVRRMDGQGIGMDGRRWDVILQIGCQRIFLPHDQSRTSLTLLLSSPHARPYHLIATACRDGAVRVFSVSSKADAPAALAVQEVACLLSPSTGTGAGAGARAGAGEVWHVEWNVTGTLLAVSSEDGHVRVFGKDGYGAWKEMDVITEGGME